MKESVKKILKEFNSNLFSIESFFMKFGTLAQTEDTSAIKGRGDYIKECLDELGIDDSKPKEEQNFSSEEVITFAKKMLKTPKLSHQNFEILSRSSFLMLNNYFEYLMADLLTYYYNKFKESLNEKKFNLSLKELNEYENLEEATKALIQKEIESIMIDLTFSKLLDHFEKDLSISLERDIIDWDKIEEFRERRHLIVHNSSIVNKKYLTRTNNPHKLNIGDKVDINTNYFESAYSEFLLAGQILTYNCWGKWDKENSNNALIGMMDETFDKSKEGKFLFVKGLGQYAQKNIVARTEAQEDILLRIKFNECIALKSLGEDALLRKELKKIRTGTVLPLFKLGHHILSNKHENILDLIRQTKALDDINLEKYQEWPLYEFIRCIEPINSQIIEELKTGNSTAVIS